MEAAERHTLPAASISIATFVLDCFNIYGRAKINRFVGKSFSYIDEQRCLSQDKNLLIFFNRKANRTDGAAVRHKRRLLPPHGKSAYRLTN